MGYEDKPGHASALGQLSVVLGDAGSDRVGFKRRPGPEEPGDGGAVQPSGHPGLGLYVAVS